MLSDEILRNLEPLSRIEVRFRNLLGSERKVFKRLEDILGSPEEVEYIKDEIYSDVEGMHRRREVDDGREEILDVKKVIYEVSVPEYGYVLSAYEETEGSDFSEKVEVQRNKTRKKYSFEGYDLYLTHVDQFEFEDSISSDRFEIEIRPLDSSIDFLEDIIREVFLLVNDTEEVYSLSDLEKILSFRNDLLLKEPKEEILTLKRLKETIGTYVSKVYTDPLIYILLHDDKIWLISPEESYDLLDVKYSSEWSYLLKCRMKEEHIIIYDICNVWANKAEIMNSLLTDLKSIFNLRDYNLIMDEEIYFIKKAEDFFNFNYLLIPDKEDLKTGLSFRNKKVNLIWSEGKIFYLTLIKNSLFVLKGENLIKIEKFSPIGSETERIAEFTADGEGNFLFLSFRDDLERAMTLEEYEFLKNIDLIPYETMVGDSFQLFENLLKEELNKIVLPYETTYIGPDMPELSSFKQMLLTENENFLFPGSLEDSEIEETEVFLFAVPFPSGIPEEVKKITFLSWDFDALSKIFKEGQEIIDLNEIKIKRISDTSFKVFSEDLEEEKKIIPLDFYLEKYSIEKVNLLSQNSFLSPREKILSQLWIFCILTSL